jgi:hypothetical protein
MWDAGVSVQDVFYVTRISHRTISDYLANRTPMLNHHLTRFAAMFDVEPEELLPKEPPTYGSRQERDGP